MKELFKKQRDKVVIEAEQEQEYLLELDSVIVPHFNHTLWEIHLENRTISKAVFNKKSTYQFCWNWKPGDKITGSLQLVKKEGCIYISALNPSNAMKHFKKGSNGNKFTDKNPLKL